MMRRVLLVIAAALCGCQSAGGPVVHDLQPGERPALDTDEAGLWMAAERWERAVLESGRVVEEEALNRYVGDIVCRLSQEHCPRIRAYVVRTPGFNASMAPNGHMVVWTGLILRAENEDQLAYVLGHEIGHYLSRHSIQRWRAIRAATDASSFFQLLTAAAGVPVVGQVGHFAALGTVLAYSREQEREADDDGLALMVRAGYDPAEAPRIWEALLAERDAEDDPQESVFFSTHPSAEERLESLRAGAARFPGRGVATRDSSLHRQIVMEHVAPWLADEERRGEFGAMLVLLDRLDRIYELQGLVAFFRGEVYRLRADEGDLSRAIAAYREALPEAGGPVQAHRSLGLVLWRAGRHAEARRAFEAYLAAAPDADDRQMVSSYLSQLGG